MKRLLLACLLLFASSTQSLAAVIGVEDVRVLAPHWTTNTTNPMTEANAAQQWAFVHELFYRTSYQQFDHATTVYPAYAVDPPTTTNKFGVTSPTCMGYAEKAIAEAIALYDIPAGPEIVVAQYECGHQGRFGTYRRPDGGTNPFVYGGKGNELAYYYQTQKGIFGGYAWVCSPGCVATWRRDIYDNAANGDHHSYNAAHRLQMGWITAAAGDVQTVYATAGQHVVHDLDAARDGQLKYLRLVGRFGVATVEVRTDRVVTGVPVVAVSYQALLTDTSLSATCAQFYLPVGATLKPQNEMFGVRLDAFIDSIATVTVIENVTVSTVPAQCPVGSK